MSRQPALTLDLLPEEYSILRFAASAPLPAWALERLPQEGLLSVTRTADELSIVCAASRSPGDCESSESGWRCLRVRGPLAFGLVGVLRDLSSALANAGVSIFAVSTFDTDYLLVRVQQLQLAIDALSRSGHRVERA